MNDHHSGILSAQLVCFKDSERNFFQFPSVQTPKWTPITILCNVYQAKDLIPSDDDGTGDPRVMIYNLGSTTFSTILRNTLNPSWNQMIKLQTYEVNGKLPSIIVQVFDNDTHVMKEDTHDFMGHFVTNLTKEHYYKDGMDLESPPTKAWYDLNLNKKQKKGKIFCSFVVLDAGAKQKNLSLLNSFESVDFLELKNLQKTILRFNILGLRNL